MILRYNNFIKENKNFDITEDEKFNLNILGIKEYKLNPETNLIDIHQDVVISNILKQVGWKTLPDLRLGIVYGSFFCLQNDITSLINFPLEIRRTFSISENKLTSLKYCPIKINNAFCCSHNKLESYEFCPKYIHHIECEHSLKKITTTLEDYPLSIIDHITSNYDFTEIFNIVKNNKDIFENLLDDKIKFHQMVMRINPSLIPYYKTIPPPTKNSKLLI